MTTGLVFDIISNLQLFPAAFHLKIARKARSPMHTYPIGTPRVSKDPSNRALGPK